MVAPDRTSPGAAGRSSPAPLRTELTAQVVSRVRGALGSITPTVVVVRGEAGSGKSTFSREVARASRARVVVQTSIAAESTFVHVALTDLVDALAGSGRSEPIGWGEAAPTVPTLGLRLRDRITEAADDGPLVVVLDDLQWIDRDSLDVVTFALRRLRDVAVVVVVAVRPPLGGAGDDPTAALEAADRLDVDLTPVPPARLRALVRGVAPDLTGDDVDAVVGQAGGNPFWAAELARSGAVRAGSGVDLRRASATARERLAALASALTEEQRVVVAAVRLAGRPPSDELRAAVATDVVDPVAALEQAEAAGLVTLVGQRWTTVHPLLGEAALQVLPAARRAGLLRRLAAAAVDPERRVHLAAEVQRPPHEPTARELAGVAEWAAARGSLQSAVGLMERSVQFTADTDERRRGERLAALASLHLRRGAFAEVLATADAVDLDLLGPGAFDTLATAVADASALVFGRARAQAAVARVEASAARRGDPMSRAVAAALTADRDYGTAQDPYGVAVAAAAVLEGATWPSPATHTVLGSVCTLGLDRGDGLDDAVVERRRRLEPRLRKAGLMPPSTGSADAHVAYVSKELGDPLTSLRRLPALVEAADRAGEEFAAFAFRVHLAAANQVCGGFGASRALLAEAGRSNSRVPPPRFPLLLPTRVWQALADESSDAAAGVLAAEAPNPTVGPSRWRLAVDHLAGFIAVVAGRHGDALEHLERAMDTAVRVGIREPGRRFHVDALLVETHLARGDLDRAERELAELDAFCRPRGRADAIAGIDRLTGLLLAARGELGPAETLLFAASDRASASPFRVEHARTAAAIAEVHALRGDARLAGETFAAVRTAFVRMPFAAGVELVDRRMRELRLTDDPNALSPAERAVVDAVVAGLTARQTGEQLHISHRTVEAHLRAVYRKLDVKGRVELTALALRGDLDRAAPPGSRRG